jgi:hypothetical protein
MNLISRNRHAVRAIVGLAALSAHLAILSSAHAIVGGDTNAPTGPNPFPWANVGKYGIGSTVFLGDINGNGTYWAITAYHNYEEVNNVAVNTTVQFGSTYNIVADSEVRLKNNLPGYSEYTDLLLFQVDVNSNPSGLVTLTLASSLPPANDTLYMAGFGGGTKRRWDTNFIPPSFHTVYKTSSYSVGQVTFYGHVASFYTLGSNGAQAEGGDSGGGVFRFNGTSYELSGIIFGAGLIEGYGAATASADISSYYDQIMAAIPEPGSLVLLATGLAGVLWHKNRRRKAA